MNKKILVVEDDPSISKLIEFNLQLVGYRVQCVFNGIEVFDQIKRFRPDLIVLDLLLPEMDGLEVCRRLREQKNMVPVIMLTALSNLSDKIVGLDQGADDYMTKPFSPRELVSRIHAILRRLDTLPADEMPMPLKFGNIEISPEQREVKVDDDRIELTPKEFDLLWFLCQHCDKVLSRQQLLVGVWDYHFGGETRIVDVHISHLRDKIEKNPRNPEYVTTIRNVGYKFSVPVGETI